MARFWLKMPYSVVVVVVVVMVSLMSRVHGLAGTEVACEPCVKSRCPELHYCEGDAVMDHCGCCQVCSSSSKSQPHRPYVSANSNLNDDHQDSSPKGRACDNVQCPKLKICRENMQGLPLCTCPGPYLCRQRRSKQKQVCGTDGLTYDSRCYLRIAACNAATRIKVARKGPCNGSEGPRCDSQRSCRKRKKMSVCGTDGQTYPSRCHMKIAACRRGEKVKVNHPGVCSGEAAAGVGGRGGSVAPFLSTTLPARHSSDIQPPPPREAGKVRKGRRRKKKKKGGSVVGDEEDGKRKRRKQGRRDKRKNRNKRRRKRRKTRQYRQRRGYRGVDGRQVMRNLGPSIWRKI